MKKSLVWIVFVVSGFFVAGALAVNTHIPATSPSESSSPAEVTSNPVVTHKQESKTETLTYASESKLDYERELGSSTIIQAGVNGSIITTYDVAYTDGKETDRKVTDTKKTAAVNQITAVGMKVTPTATPKPIPTKVPGPTYYDSEPAGATAECRDGTYSFSQSRSGTCSHHGGVSRWL